MSLEAKKLIRLKQELSTLERASKDQKENASEYQKRIIKIKSQITALEKKA